MEQTVQQQKTPIWLNSIRVVVGVLFIISGLVKANDPMGLSLKMQEFFHNWGLPTGLDSYTLILSILVITFEIIAGVALLLGYAFRLFSILLLLLIIFFTFLTSYAVWYNLYYGRELKCGCFGDCIPLTAYQSFGKDIILFILIIILVIYRTKIKPFFSNKLNVSLMTFVLVLTIGLQWYALAHLPFVDCLPYKVGNDINEAKAAAQQDDNDELDLSSISYKITKDGVEKIYTYDEYMADSTLWELEATEVSAASSGSAPVSENLLAEFAITSSDNVDFTQDLLADEGYYFLWIVKDPFHFNHKNLNRIKNIYKETLNGTTVGVIVLTSGTIADTKTMLAENELAELEVFLLDGTTSKTMMRSNPGLILLQKGKILGKWSYMDYPKGYKMNGDKIELK